MKNKIKSMFKWTLTFTKRVVTLVTILWSFQLVYSAIIIWFAVQTQGNFSYLDTFITDNGETFRLIVGTHIVSKTIENVFKYNDGGIFGKSVSTPEANEYIKTKDQDDEVVG